MSLLLSSYCYLYLLLVFRIVHYFFGRPDRVAKKYPELNSQLRAKKIYIVFPLTFSRLDG